MSTKATYTFEGKILKSTCSALRKAETSWRIAQESHKQKCHDLRIATGTIAELVPLGDPTVQGIMVKTNYELTAFVNDYKASIVDELFGAGDGASLTIARTLSHTGIIPGSVSVDLGGVTGVDNGSGVISGSGISSGTIDYDTGVISVTLDSALADHATAEVSYDYYLDGIIIKPTLEDQSGFLLVLGSVTGLYLSNASGNLADVEVFVVGEIITV